eukprot:15278503-Alexandrium_andersonii.AAC.1
MSFEAFPTDASNWPLGWKLQNNATLRRWCEGRARNEAILRRYGHASKTSIRSDGQPRNPEAAPNRPAS